jgi:hypothetical protein
VLKQFIFSLLLIMLATTSAASGHGAEYLCDFTTFGEQPTEQMVCLRGTCSSDPAEQGVIIASYTRITDAPRFCGYKIASPQYDYYQDKLFRIHFRFINCGSNPDEYLETIEDRLTELGMSYVEERETNPTEGQSTLKLVYKSADGIVAQIIIRRYGSCWGLPLIKFQSIELIDALNKEMNPRYVSKFTHRD